uniref:Embryo surrounding factor 1 brassicaceae domain-containing protein n=1 Tax=Aegilops tauschii subsp. strangulata TaxID=200361 RepID=A0A453A695_AEGTS
MMDKYTIHIYALGLLLSLHLLCCTPTVQCRIIGEEDVDDEKINLPYGLCVNNRPCKAGWVCLCCLLNQECYPSMDACKKDCLKPFAADMVSMTMTRSPLPAPFPTSSLGTI